MIRDTACAMGVLVTGLTYSVVPRGDHEIRAQVNADHGSAHRPRDHVLGLLAESRGRRGA